jgi:aspartokinase
MKIIEELNIDQYLQASTNQQVKIFVHKDPMEAEEAITHWLTNNPVKILHIGQSQSEKGGKFLFIISLFYSVNN